jgi:segregation and condensation protein A
MARSGTVEGEGGGGFLVEIDRFRGPLDLLLHLIRQQDIDIFDIPIRRITDQFLGAVEGIRAADLDSAGEFLEMAATLIRIKAQMLLPRPESDDDEDPRAELVRRLLEYEQVREITQRMERAEAERSRRFTRGFVEPRPRPAVDDVPLETTWDEVFGAALDVTLPVVVDDTHRVTPRTVSMDDKAALILDRLETEHGLEFRTLLAPFAHGDPEFRMHGVMTLLAGLELTRRRRIHLRQSAPFHELWIYRWEGPEPDDGMAEGALPDTLGPDHGLPADATADDLEPSDPIPAEPAWDDSEPDKTIPDPPIRSRNDPPGEP